VGGWDQVRAKFGTPPFSKLLGPSVRYAEDGVPVPEVIAGYRAAAERNADAEPGIPEAVLAELARRGNTVERVRVNGGGYRGIRIDPATGVPFGGTEARKDGVAAGH
jgi:gamma-glutamyltranspeptidase